MAWNNLSDAIFDHAARNASAPALTEGRVTLAYGELASLVAKASVHLRDLGIGQGVRVGIALNNCIDHVVLLFALLRVGATPVEMSADDSDAAVVAAACKYGVRAIFTEAHIVLPPDIVQHRVTLSWRTEIAHKSGDHRATTGADELDIISLTTGSTGVPSGVVWTQRQYMRRIELRLAIYYGVAPGPDFRPRDLLLTAPMRYGWFFICVLMQLVVGGRLVILPNFAKPIEMVRAIASWPGAICCVTANMCRLFLAAVPDEGSLFPDLFLLEASGLPLFPWEKRAVTTRVAANFIESYGTAGIGTISVLSAADMAAQPDSVGRPLPLLDVQIADDAGNPLPTGMFGRIRCRGVLMSRPCPESANEPRAEYFRDGWYYPGDIGVLDTEGYLHLRGRVAEIIRRGATEIFAPDLEAVIVAHPLVADAAVIGVPSQTRGEAVVAFVVKRGALQHDDLVRHCSGRLKPEQRPDRIYYIDALPRIEGGKLDRARLQSLALIEAMRRNGQ